ncbi:MAG: septal ring lytic transglycosylase RlpA family protein, partial [Alphaproteobacteria bacterium]
SSSSQGGGQSQGSYKIGKPYEIDNVWYYPAEDWDYNETGIASWYGPGFHGKSTANGESYNQNDLTAAHKTLPMPSIVEVTNLENGRSVRVRINDRGPYARGRIIDLSKRAADLLGVSGPGTAKVRVQLVADESRRIKEAALRGQKYDGTVQVASAAPTPVPTLKTTETISPQSGAPTTAVTMKPTKQTDIFVQAGAFAQEANAQRARTQMAELGPVVVSPVEVAGQKLWRVRVGPLPDVPTADEIMARAIVMGHAQARIVVE